MPRTRASATHLFVPRKSSRAQQRAARAGFAEARRQARLAADPTQAARRGRPSTRNCGPPTRPPVAPARPRPAAASSRLPAHRMTTATVSGAYPFLAEGGLGAEGIYIGRDVHAEAAFCYDPFSLYAAAGSRASPTPTRCSPGSSAWASPRWPSPSPPGPIAHGYRVYVPCDPKGEWTAVAQALGGYTIALGPGLPGRLNPLDAPARPDAVSEDGLGRPRSASAASCSWPASPAPSWRATCCRWSTPPSTSRSTWSSPTPPPTAPCRCSARSPHTLGSPERLDAALGDQAGRTRRRRPGPRPRPAPPRPRRPVRHVRRTLAPSPSTRPRRCCPSTCPGSAAPATTPPWSWP